MSKDKTITGVWQNKTPRRVQPKPFVEPTDRPFASLPSMSAEEFEHAFLADKEGEV